MLTIYRLQSDRREICEVQESTQTTDRWGIEPTHGLFGSPEWWRHIRDGTLPVHHISGKISRVYMGSMNDWPEFAVLSDAGEESEWSRYANEPEFAAFTPLVGQSRSITSFSAREACQPISTRFRLRFESMTTTPNKALQSTATRCAFTFFMAKILLEIFSGTPGSRG